MLNSAIAAVAGATGLPIYDGMTALLVIYKNVTVEQWSINPVCLKALND